MSSWTPPPELSAFPPREVAMTWPFRFLLIWNPIQLLLMVSLVSAFLYHDAERLEILKERGLAQTATVTGANECRGGICVTYQFYAKDQSAGESEYFRGQGSVSVADGINIGSKINVVFDPTDPRLSRINIYDQIHRRDPFAVFRLASAAGLVVGTIMGLGIAGFFGRIYAKEKRLLRDGVAAEAKIIDRKDYKVKGRDLMRVTYRFIDMGGNAIEGKRTGVPALGGADRKSADLRAKIMDNPTVLYDPNNSRRNLLYPPSAVRLR